MVIGENFTSHFPHRVLILISVVVVSIVRLASIVTLGNAMNEDLTCKWASLLRPERGRTNREGSGPYNP